jgi:hypothetical protein
MKFQTHCLTDRKKDSQILKCPIMIGVLEDSHRATRQNHVANYHSHCLLFVHNDTVQRFQERLEAGRIHEAIDNPYPKNFDPLRGFLNRSWDRVRSRLLGPDGKPQDASSNERVPCTLDSTGNQRQPRVNVPTVHEVHIEKAENPNAIMNYIHKHIQNRDELEKRQMIFKRKERPQF